MLDLLVYKTLLEILDLLYAMHSSPKCGYHWCAAVLDASKDSLCEHTLACRTNRDITEHLLELKAEVQAASTTTDQQEPMTLAEVHAAAQQQGIAPC